MWPRIKPLRRNPSQTEILSKIQVLINRENVRNGYPNDPHGDEGSTNKEAANLAASPILELP